MSVGKKLRYLRIKSGKTLKSQSQIFGVSLNTVYRWEHDLAEPRRAALGKIAGYYNVSLSWFLSDSLDEDIPLYIDDAPGDKDSIENKLSGLVGKLSKNHKYQLLGYGERIHTEELK